MSKFVQGITETSALIIENTERKVRKIIRDFAHEVIDDTPFDTGRLKNNWYASNRKAVKTTNQKVDKSGARSKARVEKALGRLKLGQTFYLVNSLPYARVIEFGLYPNPPKNGKGKTVNGFSKKAPAGMARINLRKAIQRIRALQ